MRSQRNRSTSRMGLTFAGTGHSDQAYTLPAIRSSPAICRTIVQRILTVGVPGSGGRLGCKSLLERQHIHRFDPHGFDSIDGSVGG
jgi:hypothetical protein